MPAAEIHASSLEDDGSTSAPSEAGDASGKVQTSHYELVGEDGRVAMRTNQHIIDDPDSQIMTMEEIEAFKSANPGSGKDLVAKIMQSHSALDQKTAYALAKYSLRKQKKYVRLFIVLPLDVSLLARWTLFEKEASKIMEMREEVMSLVRSWSNIHFTPESGDAQPPATGHGKWLLIDETAGLLTAYMAETMGVLHPERGNLQSTPNKPSETLGNGTAAPRQSHDTEASALDHDLQTNHRPPRHPNLSASISNTITVLHSLSQPNLSFLRYFHFDHNNPSASHPLSRHLYTLSWLQLLSPTEDSGYREPPIVSDAELATYKSNKRGTYYRKRRRWARIKHTVDTTRAGNFDGLVIASVLNPASALEHLVPLVRGGGQVVVYAPHVEPLAELADLYSTARRTAYVNLPEAERSKEDFPLDPRLLLAPTIYTVRAKAWQALPGRMHPLMTGKGGAEGYVFTATRVTPAEGRVEARGNFAKRRKVVDVVDKGKEDAGMDDVGVEADGMRAKLDDSRVGKEGVGFVRSEELGQQETPSTAPE